MYIDYIKEFSKYCDNILAGKKIEIPDRNKPHPLRKQEFRNSCEAMRQQIDKIFEEEMKNLRDQSLEEGKVLTSDDLKEMARIAQDKFDSFIGKAEGGF